MSEPKKLSVDNVAGTVAGAYAGSGYGAPGMIVGGWVGYFVPIVAYGAALWKSDHKVLATVAWSLPFFALWKAPGLAGEREAIRQHVKHQKAMAGVRRARRRSR